MFTDTTPNSVVLQLHLRDFYNIIFKTKHILYRAPGSAPPTQSHCNEKF